jgi:hypothetical protein
MVSTVDLDPDNVDSVAAEGARERSRVKVDKCWLTDVDCSVKEI